MKLKLLLGATLTLFFLVLLTACSLTNAQEFPYSGLTTGFITSKKIDEASGLAVSRINEDVIWINNDSGNKAALYAVNSQGEHLATLNVSGVKNHDWEDLATFNYNGQNYILIADTGDNASERNKYQLHFIKEPKLSRNKSPQEHLRTKVEWTINFAYEDRSRDCESVAIDAINQQILLLSKREFPPQLFTLPLKKQKNQNVIIARRLGKIPPFPTPLKRRFGMLDFMNYSNMPTAMDISANASMATVLTYSSAYLYFKKEGDSWLQTFAREPKRVEFPTLNQGEAIGFDQSGENIYITSEEIPAPILKIEVNKYKSDTVLPLLPSSDAL